MNKKPEQTFDHIVRYSSFSTNAGVSQTTAVLIAFVGNIAALFFLIRPATGLAQNDIYQFTSIINFAIIDSSCSNCIGGQPFPSFLAWNHSNQFYSHSSNTSETAQGANIAGTVFNNAAYVYDWSFSSSIPKALYNGLLPGHKKFLVMRDQKSHSP